MKYKGEIIESHNVSATERLDRNGNLYLEFDRYLYELRAGSLSLLRTAEKKTCFIFNELGLWLVERGDRSGGSNKNESAVYEDYYQTGDQYIDLDYSYLGGGAIIDEHLFDIRDSEWPDAYLFRKNLRTGEEIKVEGGYSFTGYDTQRKLIYSRDGDERLVCFDFDLNEKWSQPMDGHSYSDANQYPQFTENLVLINQSEKIQAYDKLNGEPVWIYKLEKSPGSFSLLNNKVYCECNTDIFILDAATGEILEQHPTGFPKRERDVIADYTVAIYPVNDDLIYACSSRDPVIKFFSGDGKTCLQKLELWESTNYGVKAGDQPVIVNDTIYQCVSNGQVYSGVGILMLSPAEEGEEAIIKTQSRLPTQYYAVPGLMEDHKFQIYIEGDRLDQVRRFAGLAIKELHYETGHIPMYDLKKGALDYLHNGVIDLIVDLSVLESNAKAVLLELIEELDRYFDDQSAMTSNKQHKITINLIDQPKDEWQYNGEHLDLKLAIKAGKKLNSKKSKKPIA